MKDNGTTDERKVWASKEKKMGLNILGSGQEACKMAKERLSCQKDKYFRLYL